MSNATPLITSETPVKRVKKVTKKPKEKVDIPDSWDEEDTSEIILKVNVEPVKEINKETFVEVPHKTRSQMRNEKLGYVFQAPLPYRAPKERTAAELQRAREILEMDQLYEKKRAFFRATLSTKAFSKNNYQDFDTAMRHDTSESNTFLLGWLSSRGIPYRKNRA